MIIQKLVKRGIGFNHKNFCQDYSAIAETNNYTIAGIFDGCSDGIDSHFASALMGKLMVSTTNDQRFILDEQNNTAGIKAIASQFMCKFVANLSVAYSMLRLSKKELLSTMVILFIDKRTSEGYIMAFGDGYININGQFKELKNERFSPDENPEADNMPDYIIYDIEKFSDHEYLRFWISENRSQFYINEVKDVIIGSDGIFTFKKVNPVLPSDLEPVQFLTEDMWLSDNPSVLSRKCNRLKTAYGYDHEDDLSLIRIINN